ncbi:acyltransferase [Fusobacterium necrophorum subsp. funduliforme]|uniref:hypothetical protein n=1 Tax=Fusobacterium necrophorum TaxID=859 RepID=UPI000245DF3C|nr:hypothetical protein [Fusobacterium necrophorum]AVQ21232.1 acyltransferase [Fusobacterium necrophorum subsp. funduliforme]EHO19010.1 hypothetical protein HMPREF9466_01926 [Fusobacterium necrophorum subsp. funduliforme 1_1_36S]
MKKKVIIVCNIALLFSACTSFTWRNSPKETIADIQLLKMAEELEKEESTDFSEKEKPEKEKPEKERVEQISEKEEKTEFPKSESGERKEEEKKENSPKIEVAKVVTERKILFVGDSVMKGSEAQLRKIFPNAIVDSAVSRQFSALPDILRKVEQSQGIPDVVVIHLGSNGNIFEKHMIESMKILGNRRVFFINCKVERPWQETVNTFLKNQVAKYKNTKLVDWYSLAHNQNQYFAKDRIHPNQMGAKVYRGMILEKLEKEL